MNSKRYYVEKTKLWCVVSPNGTLLHETINVTKSSAFISLFDTMDEAFQTKYWHKADASERAYKRMGYKVIRVTKTVEIKEI